MAVEREKWSVITGHRSLFTALQMHKIFRLGAEVRTFFKTARFLESLGEL